MTTVFISYARDDDDVARSAIRLAEMLRADGVDAHVDEWDLGPGDRIAEFMERSVHDSGAVVFGCCPAFLAKADSGRGGAGVEASHARARDYTSNLSARFFPVILSGTFDTSVPRFLRPRKAVDLTRPMSWHLEYRKLLRALRGLPPSQPPVLTGAAPAAARVEDVGAQLARAFASPDPVAATRGCINRNPFVLNALRPFKHFFPQFDFGGELDPDLVFAGWGNYTVWSLAVLCSPGAEIFDESGLQSSDLEGAIRRANGWSVWSPYDVDRDTTPDFGTLTDALTVEAYVIIGRRNTLDAHGTRRLAQLNQATAGRLKIVTYDTLLDFVASQPPHDLYHYEGEWLARALSLARPSDLRG